MAFSEFRRKSRQKMWESADVASSSPTSFSGPAFSWPPGPLQQFRICCHKPALALRPYSSTFRSPARPVGRRAAIEFNEDGPHQVARDLANPAWIKFPHHIFQEFERYVP